MPTPFGNEPERPQKGISEEDCVLYEPKYSSKLEIFKKIVMKNDKRNQKSAMSQLGFTLKFETTAEKE